MPAECACAWSTRALKQVAWLRKGLIRSAWGEIWTLSKKTLAKAELGRIESAVFRHLYGGTELVKTRLRPKAVVAAALILCLGASAFAQG
jgi:hypothetical protein